MHVLYGRNSLTVLDFAFGLESNFIVIQKVKISQISGIPVPGNWKFSGISQP